MTDTVTPAPLRPAPLEDAPTGRRGWRLRLPFSPWHLVLIPVTFILIVPLLWMLITSLETEGEANRFPPVLIPGVATVRATTPRRGRRRRSGTSSSTARW